MCGRFSLFLPPADLEERFEATPPSSLDQRYNCAPGQSLPVVPADAPEKMRCMTWGFTPSWADESFDLINARVETARETRSFADAYESRRCLVPADGFYEWDRSNGNTGSAHPVRVAFEDDRAFAMAGLYEMWERPVRQTGLGEFGGGSQSVHGEMDRIEAFTVLTTEANDLISTFHDRMPVILQREQESSWLDGVLDHATLAVPHPTEGLRSFRVSTRVNSPANDDPSLVEPVERGS